MTARRIVPIVAVVALVVYAAVLTWQLDRAEGRELKARAAEQGRILEADGWKRAAEASQRELAETVPALEKELAAAKKAKAPVVVASRWANEVAGAGSVRSSAGT